MKIFYHDPLAKQVWDKALYHFQLMRFPHELLLKGTSIYLGKNPRPHIRSTYRGYYSPGGKLIVVTENGFYQNTNIPDDEWKVNRALRTLLHEIGHHIHFSYLPYHSQAKRDPGLWGDWAEVTGYELEFNRGGQHDAVKSYEDFANDVRDWLVGDAAGTERKQFYFGLWGQEVSLMIEMKVDSPVASIDGKEVYIDPDNHNITPDIVEGRTRLPARFIFECIKRKAGQKIINEPRIGYTTNDEGLTEKITMEF